MDDECPAKDYCGISEIGMCKLYDTKEQACKCETFKQYRSYMKRLERDHDDRNA